MTPAAAQTGAAATDPAGLAAPCQPWIMQVPLSESGLARRVGDTVCFAGEIDEASAARLLAVVAEIPVDRPMVLVVRSGGGNVLAALDIAEVLLPRQVTGVVQSICASSCANSLLMASDRRVIMDDAVLVWHGGMSPGYLANRQRDLRREQARRNPDPDRLADLHRGLGTYLEGAPRQAALLEAVGADPGFFEFFDRINGMPRRRWSADCAAQPRADMVVFSDSFLLERGVVIDVNAGPKDADALRALLSRRGASGTFCFWS